MVVKLIAPENLMVAHEDQHDAPNIDVSYLSLSGRAFTLPSGVSLAA